jgi:flotillin
VFLVVEDFALRGGGVMFFGLSAEIWIVIAIGVFVLAVLMSLLARLYRKAGPHEALIVYGFRSKRVVVGRGTVVFPMMENCHELSLELMSFDVAP